MSNLAQGLVRNLDMIAPTKPILAAYAHYADETGYCWPSVETIAFDTGYCTKTVSRIRKELIKDNWMRSKRRFGTSSATRLNLQKISLSGVDRGDFTRIKPEFEFEDETAGQPQKGLTVPQFITESSMNQSFGESEPISWASKLVLDLDYGKHKRPTQKQAHEIALLCQSANKDQKLSRKEIRAHCERALKDATKNGAAYLIGALRSDRLPIRTPKPPKNPRAAKPGTTTDVFTDIRQPDWHRKIDLDPKFAPSRLRKQP